MGSSASKRVGGHAEAGVSMAAEVKFSATTAAVSVAAGMVVPGLALGFSAAVATGAAAGWSYDETPASACSCGAAAATTTTPWSAGFAASNKATRDAIHGVFEAIASAKEAASRYLYALSSAASWIAAKAYDEVKRAAANVKRRVVALIERLYGAAAAALSKTKLDSVDGPIGALDASSIIKSTVDGITGGGPSAIVSVRSPGPLVVHVLESAAATLARSSAVEMMSLLDSIPSVEKKLGLKIPVVAKVAIGVIAVAAGLCLSVCSPTMLATASVAAAAFI